MKKIILIVLSFYFLFAFSSFASEKSMIYSTKYNFRINGKSHNFDNKVFSNNLVGCGDRQYQKGSRKNESILYLTGTDFKIVGGIFDCSLQNTIFVERATNLVIENVTSSRGSDNPLEIRNSYVFVRNSTFKDSVTNKCVETENSIVIFYRNTFSNCRNGHDMELTKSGYAVSVFLENRFIKIRDDGFNCHGNVFLFLKNNTFSGQAGYTFRKFGKRKTCKNVFQIPKELEDSIKANNHIESFKIIKKIISLNINEKIFNSLSLNNRKLIQTNLINFGYNSTIDGIWGKRTSSAVQKFVEIKKLENKNSAEVIFQKIISLNK